MRWANYLSKLPFLATVLFSTQKVAPNLNCEKRVTTASRSVNSIDLLIVKLNYWGRLT
ncbi:hypothetical protein CLV75_2625 [Ruegeria conchae]|uniref:Uncharacterized protein n=1 Tax=Ruegeria conchae TaxID=981384 RepID=A0A497ZFL4_9RHOB|nr:hypothetical protein CLV75_2625 [Ruegeria conchae]